MHGNMNIKFDVYALPSDVTTRISFYPHNEFSQ